MSLTRRAVGRWSVVGLTIGILGSAIPARAQWVRFNDETATRLQSNANVGVSDVEEKDYAWADVDRDGDVDLVVVRKQPFTSPGKRTNVLFINQNGVLVDRTSDFAVDSDVAGDLGFLTPTNDRDVVLADVTGDGWLDIVTAVTISDGDPKHIGHPRVYRNKGRDGSGNWLGFRFEDFRIPAMRSLSGQSGFNPRFCTVAAGDVTGDGAIDLWFGDYDSSGAGGNTEPAGADFDDRLLINRGNGIFVDESPQRFSGLVTIPGQASAPFVKSAFGAAGAIADMNGDGVNDIVKQTSLNQPLYVGIAYNETATQGFFDTYDVVNQQSPYFISVGDLNNDAKLDIVITDDGADRFLLNQGNGTDGLADFLSRPFSFDAASDDGFGSDSVIADLNNDGWNDVLITDVDVDIGSCTRRMHIYRNLGGQPGGTITLQEQTAGTGCQTSAGNPASCVITNIPSDMLEGVHDVAVFDINGDGWLDLVVGRCTGTQVYINQPPVGLTFSYPQGIPFFVSPGAPFNFRIQVTGVGGATEVVGSTRLFASLDNGPFVEHVPTSLGGGLYQATLPAEPDCTETIRFYVTAQATGGTSFADPAAAPGDFFRAMAATGTTVSYENGMEDDVSGWTVTNAPSLTSGAWSVAVPVGTVNAGAQAAPSEDAESATSNTKAWVTQNGVPGGSAAAADVDGGPTDLLSRPIDLLGTDANITYSRWFYTSGSDTLEVSVSSDGTTWVPVETVTGTQSSWQVSTFQVGRFVTPSSSVRVRFRTSDTPNNSVTEAGIDLFRVERFACDQCVESGACSDGNFCNGAEACVGGACVAGSSPCSGQQCDEATDSCVQCLDATHCDDGNFCNGIESCVSHACVAGAAPCSGQVCNESTDSCVDCLTNANCDDGLFCNGAETCNGGTCFSPAEACPGQLCDEDNNLCIGTVQLQPRMGQPLLGLTGPQRTRFEAGKIAFDTTLTAPEGLGPTFNQDSCSSCHNTPSGGSGSITVTRFGFSDPKGVGFDPLANLGGSLLQAQAISAQCQESVPAEANVTSLRATPSTLGFGLIEAIPDAAIQANATRPPPLVSGRVHMAPVLEAPPLVRAGRFGWKAQLATVLSFSGDAALNEMGLTNRIVGQENKPNGDADLLALCDTVADPEDHPDIHGVEFVDRVTDFQRFLAPPPQTPRSGMTGESVFNAVGCANCHVRAFTTATTVGLEEAIRGKGLRPYSDFLLHDMGLNADFIAQGDAEEGELRTPPLWGLRVRDPLWHDGRVAGGTFASRVLEAIALHDALNSEARPAAQAFAVLDQADRDRVVAFLDSLGRAEFDHDGDIDVDGADYLAFRACRNGSQNISADDACAISDVDQDGDVDDDDFDLFVAAADGAAGQLTAGGPLLVGKGDGLELNLSWGPSCAAGDLDFAVYEGALGFFTSHASRLCSTGGAMSVPLMPAPGNSYYLIVPTNGFREGSYGRNGAGLERPKSVAECLPQSLGACP